MIEFITYWKIGCSVYNTISIKEEIDNIYDAIANVYSDISYAHIKSAKQSLKSALKSSNPNSDIKDAINSLRNSYNIINGALKSTREKKFLLIVPAEVYVIPYGKRFFLKKAISYVAAIISMLYGGIDKQEEALIWKKKAFKKYKKAIASLNKEDYKELQKINKKFVKKESHTGISDNDSFSSGDPAIGGTSFSTQTYYYLTGLGFEFKKSEEKYFDEFKKSLEDKSFKLD